MKRLLVLVMALALVVPAAWAGGLAGVQMDEEVMVGADSLKLNVWVGNSPPDEAFKKGLLGG